MEHTNYKLYHAQDGAKTSPVVLDVIPPHYSMHHGQPSPPQSPNTTQQYSKGKILLFRKIVDNYLGTKF